MRLRTTIQLLVDVLSENGIQPPDTTCINDVTNDQDHIFVQSSANFPLSASQNPISLRETPGTFQSITAVEPLPVARQTHVALSMVGERFDSTVRYHIGQWESIPPRMLVDNFRLPPSTEPDNVLLRELDEVSAGMDFILT